MHQGGRVEGAFGVAPIKRFNAHRERFITFFA
jgi:hypothetical protein